MYARKDGETMMASSEPTPSPVASYRHDHPPVRNVVSEHLAKLSLGQRIADRLAAAVGSWPFILVQSCLLLLWIAANLYLAVMMKTHPNFQKSWDPYPFILLNLVLSFQAAYTGPVVMMSQNRASERDRLIAQHDYEINCTSERELRVVMDHLAHQDRLLMDAVERLETIQNPLSARATLDKIEELLKRMEAGDRQALARMTQCARSENGASLRASGQGSLVRRRKRVRRGLVKPGQQPPATFLERPATSDLTVPASQFGRDGV
jgi:uncharacterized membrane protein